MFNLKPFLLFLLLPVFIQATPTDLIYLSGRGSNDAVEWDFFCTEGRKSGRWDKIHVPSCWEMEGFGKFSYGMDPIKSNEVGIYRKKFSIPDLWKGKRIFIVFEGSMTDTQVSINGKQAGEIHQGGYTSFKMEITRLLKFNKENILEVTVRKESANKSVNDAERYADFWLFGGIFRPVYLEALPDKYIEKFAVNAKMDGSITAEVFLSEPYPDAVASVEVKDINGKIVGSIASRRINPKENKIHLAGKIDNVKPWSAESPTLYTAKVELSIGGKAIHSVSDRIGFRTVEVREKDGIYINGVKIRFKGVNRHTSWPTTGRTISNAINLQDARLIKEMNMNAVRLPCYTPDRYFFDLCDSLGLYATDELCEWHLPLDSQVGKKMVKELIDRDLNHPSIIFWANGNEGGFNLDLDTLFTLHDIQKRPVLHPWITFSGINTVHYPPFNAGIYNQFNGRDIIMSTEFLHGLYDGGHGAGLDDFWNQMLSNPRSAGGFLWDFVDLGIIRSDRNDFMDTDTNHGADGIVGPYREKEGSFYAIKEIWSPIVAEKGIITPSWNGNLVIENRYSFTNAKECTFSFRLSRVISLYPAEVKSFEGIIPSIDLDAGEKGILHLDLPQGWFDYDILNLTAKDKNNQELFTCSWELGGPARVADRLLKKDGKPTSIREDEKVWSITASGVQLDVNKETGLMSSLSAGGKTIPLSNGPSFIQADKLICKSVIGQDLGNTKQIVVNYLDEVNSKRIYSLTWTIYPSGLIRLEYSYPPSDMTTMAGITFNFPEVGIKGASLLSNGPYRVYKNRMKGGTLGIWEKKYNNTITGESWDYPEFKGYYSFFYGMRLDCATPFEVYTTNEDTFLHLFTPSLQVGIEREKNYTNPSYPAGNISFMQAISAVGGKFDKAENFGPQSQPYRLKVNRATSNTVGQLFFKFL